MAKSVEMREVNLDIDFRTTLAAIEAYGAADGKRYTANPTGDDASGLLRAIFEKIEEVFPGGKISLLVHGTKILYEQG